MSSELIKGPDCDGLTLRTNEIGLSLENLLIILYCRIQAILFAMCNCAAILHDACVFHFTFYYKYYKQYWGCSYPLVLKPQAGFFVQDLPIDFGQEN